MECAEPRALRSLPTPAATHLALLPHLSLMHLAPTTSLALPRIDVVSQPRTPWGATLPFLALGVHESIPQMFIERLLNV